MNNNYTISFKFGDKILTPKQKNTPISTMINLGIEFAIKKLELCGEAELDSVILYRPNFSVEFLSAEEKSIMEEFKVPLIIQNNKGEEKIFNYELNNN